MTDAKVCAVLLLAVVSSASFSHPLLAQSIRGNDNTSTLINRDGDRYIIRGGSLSRDGRNLFHSFERLGLSAGEIAEFISTPSIDNVLGHVTGGNPSVIDGLLRMTGGNSNLYLINPAGIIFGPHARLDLPASFLATTATGIGFNQHWLDAVGDNHYADLVGNPDQFYFSLAESGVITNAGNLSVSAGESLTLLGGTVVNTGTLSAAGGTITVAAVPGQSRVRLTQAGTLLSLEIEPLADGPFSEGGLRPASLPELLTGGAIATATGLTVDPDGTVRLTSTHRAIATQPGTVVISGTLDAASPTAIPEINLVGDRVMVLGANLDASGRDGGRIRIGGDYRGQGAIATATATTIDADTTITANSLTATGDGGRIFVWADDTTRFDGTLSARGGAVAGQGGFVELSGARYLTVTGTVDLTAANGAIGTLLLDPTDITIVNGDGGGNDAAVTADGQVLAADDAGVGFTISETALEGLASNTNIILEASNNIVINDLIDNELTFATASGNSVTFNADSDRDGNGGFTMDATDTLLTQGGDLSITGNSVTVGGLEVGEGRINLTGDEIDLLGRVDAVRRLRLSDGSEDFGGFSDAIRFSPLTTGQAVVVGGATDTGPNTLDITLADLDALTLEDVYSAIEVVAGTGAITVYDLTGSLLITLAASEMNFVGGPDSIRAEYIYLRPDSVTQDIYVGGSGDRGDSVLDLTATDVAALDALALSIAGTTGTLTVESLAIPSLTLGANEINLVGGNNSVRAASITFDTTSFDQNIVVGGSQDSGAGSLDLTRTDLDALSDNVGNLSILGGSGTLTVLQALQASNSISLVSDEINLLGGRSSIRAPIISLATGSTAQNIIVGGRQDSGSNALDLTTSDLNALLTAVPDLSIRSLSGTLTVLSDLRAADNLSLAAAEINLLGGRNSIQAPNIYLDSDAVSELRLGGDRDTGGSSLDLTNTDLNALQGENIYVGRAGEYETPYLPIVVAGALNLSERLDLFTTGGLTIAGNISARIIDLSSEFTLSEEDFEPYVVTFNQNVSLTATDTIVLPDQLIGTGNASIRLSANNGILTATSSRIPSAQAGAITANGGITLISRTGAIAVGDLTTAGSNAGGNVVVQARDRITTGAIDTSATDGNGGAVTLDPIGDIEVVSINSQGGANGQGGAIDITTDRFFRATGTFTDRNGALASLSSAGGNGGGQITIRHGGGLLNTPYDVGSSADNATAGVITTGEFTIAEGRSFPRSYTLGNISLITTDPTQDTDTPATYDGIFPDLRTTENLAIATPESLTPIKSLSEVQASLSAMEAATGIKPAVIYVRFVNPTLPPNDNFLERETALTQEFEEHLGIPSYTALQIAPQPTDQLELLIVTPEGNPIRRLVPVTREQITATAVSFRGLITQASSSPNRYLPPAQLLHGWLVAPVEQDLQTLGIQNLTFILDAGLRSLPLAALHDGNQFLVERYSVGLMPSFSLTNTRYIDLRDTQVLAMGASSFTEQPALPAVPTELAAITQTLWNGKSLINEEFTVSGLVDQRRQQPFGIVHLATHGEFNAGAIENSYIQFWDQRLRLDQIRQLNFNRPPVELLVLSACRTALGNEQAELGFAGLAVQSGVQSALASLWYVSDTGTLGLMTEFYRQLQQMPIKAEALRRAQVAMINGEIQLEQGMLIGSDGVAIALPESLANTGTANLPHPYYWSAFTLIGSPW